MSTRNLHRSVLALLLCVSPMLAQSDPAPGNTRTPSEIQQQVDKQVQQMREQLAQGKRFTSHVRVTAKLKNGNTIRGVVKEALLVERLDGLRFVTAEQNDPGAGVRIYYWNGSGSYVFLPFTDVADYKINERLSVAQLRAIEAENKKRDELSQKDRDQSASATATAAVTPGDASQQPATQPQPQPSPTPGGEAKQTAGATGEAGKTDPGTPTSGLSKEQQELFALVNEYPPAAGWSAAKRDEISRRMAVVGSKPSESELRFVARFADWQRACAAFNLKPAEPTGAQPGSAPATETRGTGSRRNRNQ